MVEELDEVAVPIYHDERGKVRDFRGFLVQGLHVVTMQPGAVRGNHVHDRDEIMCVISGDGICEILAEDDVSGAKESVVVTGDLKTYRIEAGTKHVVRNIGTRGFYLLCFYESHSKPAELS